MTARRRGVLAAMVALLIAPSAFAQPPAGTKVYRIGYLIPWSAESPSLRQALLQGLQERGYVEGRNIQFERRFAEDKPERLPALAAELVQLGVDIILTPTPPATQAAARATQAVPIVFVGVAIPVELGIVASLARPGGNVTGLTWDVAADTLGKQIELLKQINPEARSLAAFRNPDGLGPAGTAIHSRALEATAQALGMKLRFFDVTRPEEVDGILDVLTRERPDGLFVGANSVTVARRKDILGFAVKQRIPTIHGARFFVDEGGLISYGSNLSDIYRRAGAYIDRVLKGARPADLPVEQPARLELAVNLRTAKALGVKIPQSIIVRADHVVQ